MRTLAIDTSSAHLSVALFEGATLIGHDHRLVGRGHAEQLIPAIAALPDGGKASAILVGCGPGSFTGIRICIAAARALAFAWGASLTGFDSLALIAAHAGQDGAAPTVVVDGGHGEYYVAAAPMQVVSLTPEAAAQTVTAHRIAGQRAHDLVALRGWGEAIDAEADARAALRLPPAALLPHATPLYGRAPDAKPMALPV